MNWHILNLQADIFVEEFHFPAPVARAVAGCLERRHADIHDEALVRQSGGSAGKDDLGRTPIPFSRSLQ
jgi:hypothetical protein